MLHGCANSDQATGSWDFLAIMGLVLKHKCIACMVLGVEGNSLVRNSLVISTVYVLRVLIVKFMQCNM